MGAVVVNLGRQPFAPAVGHRPEQAPARGHIWQGASGRAYAHKVYSLIECPPLPRALYVLVRSDAGSQRPLCVGVAASDAPTLNLAAVRQKGAQAGASEVHVLLEDAAEAELRLIACDLRAGLFGSLAANA